MRKLFLWILAMSFTFASVGEAKEKPGVTKKPYGKMPDGTVVDQYTMVNSSGMTVKVITLGGIITELHVPDGAGKLADVALGCSSLEDYLGGHPYFGALVGRYANRIAKGKFSIDGKEYTLAVNNAPNALHGGKVGFDKVVWNAEIVPAEHGVAIKFSYVSKDGEEGYPGTLTAAVTYTLTDKNELKFDYAATTDKKTVINLTQHCYFNLAGHDSGDILGHEIMILADQYTPGDDTLIPTGKIEPVKGTPFDFTEMMAIGKRIKEIKADPVGYDLNYVLREGKGLRTAAVVMDPKSRRVMEVSTTEPGIQFYSGNFLDGKQKGKGGFYKQYSGFCLEAQHFPDSPNKKDWPSVILEPGKTYTQTTVYKFSLAR